MGGANVTLQCHLMSGDFEDADQYTPTIDDNRIQDKEIYMSDHLDAPGMKPPNMDARVDICDIYAFQKPGDANKSVLTNGAVTADKVGPHQDLLAEFPYVGPPHLTA
jgi:hypothetical protein